MIFRVGLFVHHRPVEGGTVLHQIAPFNFFIGILSLQITEHLSGDPLTAVILQHLDHADMGPSLENAVPQGAHCQFPTDGLHEHINLTAVGAQRLIQYPGFLWLLRGCHAAGVSVDGFRGEPIRFFRQLGVQLPHFGDLRLHTARPQVLFRPLPFTQKILAVSTQTI